MMIRRKDSFGFIDVVRGKYPLTSLRHLRSNIDEMSVAEKLLLQRASYDDLLRCLSEEVTIKDEMVAELQEMVMMEKEDASSPKGGSSMTTVDTMEEILSPSSVVLNLRRQSVLETSSAVAITHNEDSCSGKRKYSILKQGIMIQNQWVTLDSLLAESQTQWEETEWEFPKGRKMYNETDLTCALREFEEETGYSQNDIEVLEHVLPFEEIFVGSNHKPYKHKYFVGKYHIESDLGPMQDTHKTADIENTEEVVPLGMEIEVEADDTNFQRTEVSKVEWKTLDECIASIRSYSATKKKLIKTIEKLLNNETGLVVRM